MKALFIVDLQNDFCPHGALPTPKGDAIIPVVNKLMSKFDFVLASKDWHPEKSVHFKKWPVHCVHDTHGAEFPSSLTVDKIDTIFLKGTDDKDDGYSAFEASNINLADYLKKNKITALYVAGLVIEFCVKRTVMDALKHGLNTFVVKDAVEGIYQNPGDVPLAFEEMKNAGATIIHSSEIVGGRE
ncbi:nicotinamidase/pyrazinamidase [Saccharicrinis carchari]|uniref:nicotinamidase n=1 Tax=Saccharicrinis carchari TaxID=1168039 RepID=A0A521DNS3_SACCC|nr:isochorismatase family protein [Saccharicrinis carchari]SMO73278.1 nicotinamidase/pyrazinamidase [Saccharicrinis carchari]